ncbi:hypothetical protein MCAG_00929 [Micromonospora sp. ATCC 39149]|nr:hypothetical protein MCAG_00929 [Micromonospora sp. ATCC 39149]
MSRSTRPRTPDRPVVAPHPSYPGHDAWAMLGANGCGASPVHVEATPIRFDVAVPGDLLNALTWRNRRGEQRTLKYVVNGRLERSLSIQGVYRLTDESAAQLGALLDRSPTPSQRAEANHAHHGRQPSVTVDAR